MDNPAKQFNQRKVQYKLHYFANEKYSVFLYYFEGHPVNYRQKFSLGHLHVFDDNKMYRRELFSTEHLNSNSQWNNKYFLIMIEQFGKFQIRSRNDSEDKTLDFEVRGNLEQGQNEILLQTTLEQDFSSDVQKQFWKDFQTYNDNKNEQIFEYEETSKRNIKLKQSKLQEIKKLQQECQEQKKKLLSRLSAILTQKVNKLKQFQQDYSIELFQDKVRKVRQQQDRKVLSTYQEQAQLGATLFQASQDFRQQV